jgi:uncharacterized protein YkwD
LPAGDVCPHCQGATRWYYARDKKKCGPYTWPQLVTLVNQGMLRADDMVLQEGAKKWVRADSLPNLFAKAEPLVAKPVKRSPRRSPPWLLIGVVGSSAAFVLICLIGSVVYWQFSHSKESRQANQDRQRDEKTSTVDGAPTTDKKPKPPKKEEGSEAPTPKPPEQKPPEGKQTPKPAIDDTAEKLVARLNAHRKSAGLTSITLDKEMSRGCDLHAKYLVLNFDPEKKNLASANIEDPQKPGYTPEGERAAKAAITSTQPPAAALERWMGRLASRAALLNPDMRSIGVGHAASDAGNAFCVVDVVRGRGEAIVVYPAPKQTDVPIAFTGGPEVPESNAAAGYPITVTFPPGKDVRQAKIELHDGADKPLEGWTWTPDMAPRPGLKINTLALIPKGLLKGQSAYQVKATAQVDGQPWELSWSFTTEDSSDTKGIWAKKLLDRVNAYRAHAKLAPVTLDATLSKACLAHARYLVINEGHPSLQGLKAHSEDQKLPGYSKEGDQAGKESDIAIGDHEPTEGLESWMATLYHRIPILDPTLKTIGFGCERGRRQGWATVMNLAGGRDKTAAAHPVFYPAPDQTDVPLHFPNSGEEPNPIPDDPDGRAGYPITASFPRNEPLKNASATLTDDKGKEVACWFSSPEKLANPQYRTHQGQTVCLIAKNPLAHGTTYHVHLRGELAGKSWEKKWKFTTILNGVTNADATAAVVERLNRYRAAAGLNTVVLDEKLSIGCRRHAEYLGKNADVLNKRKAPVDDEDATLPWFSAEGLRSAKQSLIFTNAPTPVVQIDELMGTFASRVHLLDPNLRRVGYGCYHDVGRGWRCVLDSNGGRGDGRIVLYPAPKQSDVPTIGYDQFAAVNSPVGFPITVMFPPRANLRKATAALLDVDDMNVECRVTSPEAPLAANAPRNVVSVHPLQPLRAGHTYLVTVSVIVDGDEWRQSWRFTTAK